MASRASESSSPYGFAAPIPAEYAHLPEWQRLVELGIDADLLASALRMTPTQRLDELAARDAVFCELHGTALGRYTDFAARAVTVHAFDRDHQLIALDDLIAIKKFVARPKDLIVAAQLEAIRAARSRS